MTSPPTSAPSLYQAILESLGEGIIFVDAEDNLAIINHNAEEIRGIKASNFIGRSIYSIHSPLSTERISKLILGLKNGTIPHAHRVIEVRGKFIENNYYPVRHPDGVYLGTLLISRDITEKQQLKHENQLLRDQMSLGSAFEGFVGTSQAILQVFRTISAIASLDSTILVTGESGSGKELIATAIHQQSKRRQHPMIAVNCAALPEHLVESELFGHMRGAFTGAVASHRGKFEQAHLGTLFLDEIGDLPLNAQAKLLRVIQDKTVMRLGAEKEIAVNVRIIAATNQNLSALVTAGKFRQDLYYRLNVISIHTPPLRDRRDDIIPLAEYFIKRMCAKMEKSHLDLSEAAITVLRAYDYPGNVRELEHAIERAVALCTSGCITPQDLPTCFLAARTDKPQSFDKALELHAVSRPLAHSLVDMERQLILNALTQTGGRKAEAARLLNISRKTLWQKLKQMEYA